MSKSRRRRIYIILHTYAIQTVTVMWIMCLNLKQFKKFLLRILWNDDDDDDTRSRTFDWSSPPAVTYENKNKRRRAILSRLSLSLSLAPASLKRRENGSPVMCAEGMQKGSYIQRADIALSLSLSLSIVYSTYCTREQKRERDTMAWGREYNIYIEREIEKRGLIN